ncbi:hypothetical protein HanOQP8_Chr02g0048981 [Helianthus annuus]|nr:hypothetical protein HanOQP8_Chr02g0048981 [Helianthus annuus]
MCSINGTEDPGTLVIKRTGSLVYRIFSSKRVPDLQFHLFVLVSLLFQFHAYVCHQNMSYCKTSTFFGTKRATFIVTVNFD